MRVVSTRRSVSLLPQGDGVLVGHGAEIRHYHDRDGDGVADDHEVLLRGFGVQDSHLMPHQFTLGPGGWVYMAQGAFNRSDVLAGGEPPVEFDYCKLGRFRLRGEPFFETVAFGRSSSPNTPSAVMPRASKSGSAFAASTINSGTS